MSHAACYPIASIGLCFAANISPFNRSVHQWYTLYIIGNYITVGPRLSKPLIIRTVQLTVLLEYFDFKSVFYKSSACSIRVLDHNFEYNWMELTNSLIWILLWCKWDKGVWIIKILLYDVQQLKWMDFFIHRTLIPWQFKTWITNEQ